MYLQAPGLDASISVLSNRDEADARARALDLWRTFLAPGPRRWQLWRQDDNGNSYLVSVHPDEDSARARLAAFESGVVHKQSYWVTRP
jgi:hypothetical protein